MEIFDCSFSGFETAVDLYFCLQFSMHHCRVENFSGTGLKIQSGNPAWESGGTFNSSNMSDVRNSRFQGISGAVNPRNCIWVDSSGGIRLDNIICEGGSVTNMIEVTDLLGSICKDFYASGIHAEQSTNETIFKFSNLKDVTVNVDGVRNGADCLLFDTSESTNASNIFTFENLPRLDIYTNNTGGQIFNAAPGPTYIFKAAGTIDLFDTNCWVGGIVPTNLMILGPSFVAPGVKAWATNWSSAHHANGYALDRLDYVDVTNGIRVAGWRVFGRDSNGNMKVGKSALNSAGASVSLTEAFGDNAALSATNGHEGVFAGESAAYRTITFDYDTIIGSRAAYNSVTLGYNSVLGTAIGYNATNVYRSAMIGYHAAYNPLDIEYDVDIGWNTMRNALVTMKNVAVGASSGGGLTNGTRNLFLGYAVDSPYESMNNWGSIMNSIFLTNASGLGTNVSASVKVGIATNTPQSALDVHGKIHSDAGFLLPDNTLVTNATQFSAGGGEANTITNAQNISGVGLAYGKSGVAVLVKPLWSSDGSVTITDNTTNVNLSVAAGGGSGTVTNVAVSGGTGLSVSGSPITTGGTISLSLTNDLAAVEGIAGTGLIRRTGAETWSAGTAVDLAAEVTGDLPVGNLNGGTSASSSTYWRGDGTWATPGGGGTVTSVGLSGDTGLNIDGSPITGSGTIAITLSNDLAAVEAITDTGLIRRDGAETWSAGTLVDLVSEVTGNLPVGNLDYGNSASSSTFWRGDGTWATPSGGSSAFPQDHQIVTNTAGNVISWTNDTYVLSITGDLDMGMVDLPATTNSQRMVLRIHNVSAVTNTITWTNCNVINLANQTNTVSFYPYEYAVFSGLWDGTNWVAGVAGTNAVTWSGTGIASINGDSTSAQTITTNASGSDFAVATTGGATTISLPDASASARGVLTASGWTTFNAKPTQAQLVTASNDVLTASHTYTDTAVAPLQTGSTVLTNAAGGLIQGTNATLGNLTITNAINYVGTSLAYSGTNVWIDFNGPVVQDLTLTNNCRIILTNLAAYRTKLVHVYQDSVGTNSISFDSHIRFSNTNAPSISTNGNAWSVLSFAVGKYATNAALVVNSNFMR